MDNLNKKIYVNFIGYVFPMLVALLCIPYLYRSIDAEIFGVLSLLWAVVGYFGLFDLGLGRTLTYKVAQSYKENKTREIERIFWIGMIVSLVVGVVSALILIIFATPYSQKILNLKNSSETETYHTFLIVSVTIPLTTVVSIFRGGLEGLGDFRTTSTNRGITGMLLFMMPLLFVLNGWKNIDAMALSLFVARLLVLLHLIPHVKVYLLPKKIEFIEIKKIISYGGWVSVSSIIGPVMVYGDRFFISTILSVDYLPVYTITQELMQRMLIIPAAISGVAFAVLSAGKSIENNKIFWSLSKKIFVVMSIVLAVFAVSSSKLFEIWISKEFSESSSKIVVILSIGLLFNSVAQMPLVSLYSKNKPKIVAVIHCSELVLYSIFLVIMIKQFGITGAAFAWTTRAAIDCLVLFWLNEKIDRVIKK